MKADAISIVEAAYDCESDTRAWLRRVLEQVGPRFDQGFGVGLAEYVPNVDPAKMGTDAWRMDGKLVAAFLGMASRHVEIFHSLFSQGGPLLGTPTANLGLDPRDAETWPPYVTYLHPFGVREVIGALVRDPSGHALAFSAARADLRRPTRSEVASWSQIAAHISAGARLRRALPGMASADVAEGAEAVLSPSGAIAHAEVAAQSRDARESLRVAAKAMDRARSKARANEDEALELWQGLVAGRWSLIDRFDSDGRRLLIARKNDPDVADPRALTLRERQVLAYTAMGHSLKLIAYSLGVSTSSVSTSRKAAMRKLGLRTHADVVQLFAPAPLADAPHDP